MRARMFALVALLVPGRAHAQTSERTLPMDPPAVVELLRLPDHWGWLRAEHPDAAIVFSDHRINVSAAGTRGVVELEHTVLRTKFQDGTIARCSASTPDGNRWRAADEARNLCDQIAAETMPRATELPGYWYQIVLVDLLAGPIAPSIVHLAHRRPKTALVSLGLHVGAIGVGVLTGLGISLALPPQAFEATGVIGPGSPNYLPQMFVGMLIGAATGMVAAAIFDAAYLARPRYGLPSPAWQF